MDIFILSIFIYFTSIINVIIYCMFEDWFFKSNSHEISIQINKRSSRTF